MDPTRLLVYTSKGVPHAHIRIGDSDRSVLDERFEGNVTEDSLKPLLAVIQGLMRLMPSQRISVSQALDVVRVSQQMLAEDVDTSD